MKNLLVESILRKSNSIATIPPFMLNSINNKGLCINFIKKYIIFIYFYAKYRDISIYHKFNIKQYYNKLLLL
jgi:hypothetical protein